jgi:hypothetical protein
VGDFYDRLIEHLLIRARRLAVAAHFSHELERGGGDFLGRGMLVCDSQDFNAAAHDLF